MAAFKPERVLGCIQLAANVPGSTPVRVEVMPVGKFTHQGRTFTVTEKDLEGFAADINDRGDRIPIDYDHSFMEGGSSIAAGWYVPGSAEVSDGILSAEVEWTAQAAQEIKEGKYRFFSPEFSFKKKDQETGKLLPAHVVHASGLTNRPFFHQLAPVTASDRSLEEIFSAADYTDEERAELVKQGKAMSGNRYPVVTLNDFHNAVDDWNRTGQPADVKSFLMKRAKAEGWEDAMPDDWKTTSASAAGGKESTMKGLAEVYGLKADASEDEILAAAQAHREKATELETENTELKGKTVVEPDTLEQLKASAAKGEIAARKLHDSEQEHLLTAAVSEGKLLPTQKTAYAALFDIDPEGTTKMIGELAASAFPTSPIGHGNRDVITDEDGGRVEVMRATVDGNEYEADTDSARIDHEARRILTAAGKLTYSADEYFAAADLAQRKLGINRDPSVRA